MGHSSCLPPNNISQHTMKVLAIITFVALGALVNGQDDAVGVIDCDAVGIVAAALAGTMDLAETAKAYNLTEADVSDNDKKSVQAMIDAIIAAMPASTKANIEALDLGALFEMASTGDMTDFDLRKAIVDKVTELGFKPEDAMQAVIDQCADYFMDIIDAVNDAADYQDLADAADYQDLADLDDATADLDDGSYDDLDDGSYDDLDDGSYDDLDDGSYDDLDDGSYDDSSA